MTVSKITENGYRKLQDKLIKLKEEQNEISKSIAYAFDFGDIPENSEYIYALEYQILNNRRIASLQNILQNVEIVKGQMTNKNIVSFGSTVKILDLNTDKIYKYKLLGEYEFSIDDGELSVESPVGRLLMGKKINDVVEVETPNSIREYQIITIE